MIPPHGMQTIKNLAGKSVLILPAMLALLTGCMPPGPRALLEGKQLLERGKYERAIEQLQAATVLLGSTNAQAFNYLGLALHGAGQLAEADRAYQQALRLNPDLAEARYNLGCLWLETGKLDAARSELTTFTLRRGSAPEGWIKLGVIQMRLNELAAAEKSLSEALRLNPQSPQALTTLGLLRIQRGRPAEAVQCFERALKEQPNYPPALLNLAIVEQEHLKDRPSALRKYRDYLAISPPPSNAEAVRSIVRQLESDLSPTPPQPVPSNTVVRTRTNPSTPAPAATNVFAAPPPSKPALPNPVRSPNPAKSEPAPELSRSPAITNIPRVVATTNPPKPAPLVSASSSPTNLEVVSLPTEPVFQPAHDVPAANASTQSTPTEPVGSNSVLALGAGDSKPAKRGFFQRLNPFAGDKKTTPSVTPLPTSTSAQKADSITPPTAGTGSVRLQRYLYRNPPTPEAGNRPEAERAFSIAIQAHKSHRLSEAIQGYRRAMQLDPTFFDAAYNLGLAATEAGTLPSALQAYENALAIRPESLDAHYNFALVLKQANYAIDAVNEFEKIIAVYPAESRSHLALANLYAQQLNQPVKARQHYLKVIEIDPQNPQGSAIRYWLADHPQ